MSNSNPTTIAFYADQTLKAHLEKVAQAEGRSVSSVIRRALVNSLDNLSPLEKATLHQVAKDEGLDCLVQAASHIIGEWQSLKRFAHREAAS